MALLLAGVLAFLTIPYLKEALHLTFEQSAVNKPLLFLFVVLLVPFITISAGFYPALILSNFKPIQALKGKFRASGQQEVTVRKGLVIAQFLVAQVLIICTLAVLNQMHYLQTAPLGFTKESVVTVLIPRDSVGVAGIEPFRNRLLAQPGIKNVSFSLSSPASVRENFWNGFRYDQSAKDEDFNVNLKLADAEYFKTYGIEFVAGRPYLPSDTIREIVVNQTLLKKLGVTEPQQAIGKTITLFGKKYPLVGVVKDFHITSLKEEIVPVLITTDKRVYWQANIQLQTQHLAETMAAIDKNYKSVYPQSLFEYEFVEEAVAGFYKEEKKLANLFRVFVTIAILISCLGLYGLVSFLAAQKVKEIGIRKILGASLADIIILLSKDFIQLVVIAFIIASPIAWYAMTQWLQNFEYRAPIGWWVFALAGLIAVLIALVTISFQAVKAAVANPVNSLRSE
jgi:ABC-type antimicrobial peptide transport system permease subunit